MMSLVHVFCFLYSTACQSYSRCSHIDVFCSVLSVVIMLSVIIVLSVIIMLSVITRSRHLSHDVAHMYVLLLVFCFLCSASYVLLLVFCFLCFASCILLHTHAVVILICVFCSESLVVTVLPVLTVSCRS